MVRVYSLVAICAAALNALALAQVTRYNVLVSMEDGIQTTLGEVDSLRYLTRADMIKDLRDKLDSNAKSKQFAVEDALKKATNSFVRYESVWITNQMYIEGATQPLIDAIKGISGVQSVTIDELVPNAKPISTKLRRLQTSSTATPNIAKINAPSAWNSGNTGAGVVVGIIDTGVRYSHEALRANWRSTYGWFDPEYRTTLPYDASSSGHGTHVTGVIAGLNGIGVAPGAKWIACKGCRSTGCYTSELLACLQWMLCPTTTDGSTSDCSRAPNVVNNSWGGAAKGTSTFNAALDALRVAKIIPVFSAGNSGPSCNTISAPAEYPGVITAGAVDTNDIIAGFSSKGNSIYGVVKPDVMAPGVSIKSSCATSDIAYCTMSGTSFSSAHVSGTIAILMAAKPGLTFDQVKTVLQGRATKSGLGNSNYICSGTTDYVWPNNQFGAGRVDAFNVLI